MSVVTETYLSWIGGRGYCTVFLTGCQALLFVLGTELSTGDVHVGVT